MAHDTLLVSDDAMLAHDPGPGHPESAERLRAILRELERSPVPGTRWERPQPAPRAALERVHSAAHVARMQALRGREAQLDDDTVVRAGSVQAALLAAGGALRAVEAVVRGEARRAFALVRPPGHHAERDRAMGFCLFNNVAVAAEHARVALGCERVLVVDWDVHHSNGTQDIFAERADVLLVSLHQAPLWPGSGALGETGSGAGAGRTLNVPLPPGMHDADYVAAARAVVAPVAELFRPDLVLVSAGFDAHRDDPEGGMELTEAGYAALCGVMRDVADARAQGRLALVLEGGYAVDALARSVRACVEVLAGGAAPDVGAPGAESLAVIAEARRTFAPWWPVR